MLLYANRIGDGLDLGVLVEAGGAVLAADAAGLVAAERRVGAVAGGAVDAEESGAQASGDGQPVFDRAGHHVARQPVRAVVRDPHRIVLVRVRDDGKHRTEDLLLRDGHRVVDVDEKRWLDEETLVESVGLLGPADHQPRALVDALLDVAADAAALLVRDHRTAERAGVLRIAAAPDFRRWP